MENTVFADIQHVLAIFAVVSQNPTSVLHLEEANHVYNDLYFPIYSGNPCSCLGVEGGGGEFKEGGQGIFFA
jgi:hypothetical protein